uniref:Immunoglobulin superfamily member 22 n=1 Tax=Cynoglossus semilaevis TaxID=244447 RepID=A0A3P8UGP9_CYNSE
MVFLFYFAQHIFFVLYLPYHEIESKKPPVFDVPLKPLTVDEGKKLTLRCHVCGSAPLKVQWMKDRKDLISAGSTKISFSDGQEAKLEIREATKSDSGQYRCVASSKHGEIECSTELQVVEKKEGTMLEGDLRAKLKKTPSKQKSPKEKEDIDIVELLRNVDPKEYEKYARMYGITDYRGLLQAIEQLKKEKVFEESGRLVRHFLHHWHHFLRQLYLCMNNNLFHNLNILGRMKCTVYSITPLKHDFLTDISDQTVLINKEAEFGCELKINYPEITLSWYKGTQKLESDDKYDISISGDRHLLKIKKCQSSDQGNYRVVCGPYISSAKLTVMGQLKCLTSIHSSFCFSEVEVEKHLKDTAGKEGQLCTLSCQLSIPNVEAQWFKNGRKLEMKGRYSSEGKVHSLTVRDVQLSEAGQVKITAKDFQAEANLIVKDQDVVTDAGKPIVLFVPYSAYPQAKADWLYDNQNLPQDNIYTSADRTEYRLKDPKKSDQGRYKITIKNKHGEGEAFINLQVIDVPGPVKNLQVIDTADGEVSLAWEEPESDGGSKVIGYVVERRDVKRKTWTLATERCDSVEYTVTGLQKDSMYLFRVCARNRVGAGPNVETDKPVQAKNKFDVPGPPLNLIVGNVSKFGCTVSWDMPESDGGSPITSYIIELRDRTSVQWSPVQVTKADELSAIINDVIENKEYIFRVKAENKAGVGKPSAASHPVKIMDPIGDPPQNLVWQDQNKSSVQLSWETPLSNGGSIITGYIIERCEEGSDKWLRCNARLCPDLFYKVIKKRLFYPYPDFLCSLGIQLTSISVAKTFFLYFSAFKDGLEVIVPQPLTIRVPISGYPTPVAKWTFQDKELTTADERVSMMTKSTFTELTVTPSVRPDKGIYVLQLENDVTSVSGEIEVNNLRWRDKSASGIFLSWEPPKYDGGSTIRGYNVDRCQRGTDKWEPCGEMTPELKCEVTGLTEGQWYSYRVRALNRLGAGLPCKATDEIQAVDPKEIQLDVKLLAGLTAKAGSKIELPAEVKGKPEPKVKWTKADLILQPDDRVSINTKPGHSMVTIAKTARNDSSTYIIEATNSSGRATATVDVNILGESIYKTENAI